MVKRERGNGGIGVWKVEVPADSLRPITATTAVLVHGAEHRDTDIDEMDLAHFFEICAPYFTNGGVVIDQAFQRRVTEGLVRAYLVVDSVVGFPDRPRTHSSPTRTAPPAVMGLPSSKTMFRPDSPGLA